VSAVTDTKVHDGTTSSSVTPVITVGTLATGDTAGFTQSFDTKNVGTGETLAAADVVLDGNAGSNYAMTFVTVATGVITARAVTVTADNQTKIMGACSRSQVRSSGSLAPR